MPAIRPETADDHAAVREVNRLAFGRTSEADLVDVLRQEAHPHVSLVAEEEGQILGHVFFSPVEVEGEGDVPAMMGLAPMAVLPGRQRRGIGSALVQEGLRACWRMGCGAVVVLGHPTYYPRFGFGPASSYGLRSAYDVPNEAFMALELRPGALEGADGRVKYPEAFRDAA